MPEAERDDLLLAGLAAGQTIKAAAAAAGMSERTARRRRESPEFRQAERDMRGRLVESALTLAAAAMTEAVGVQRSLMKHKDPWVKLAAARDITNTVGRMREAADLAVELAELRDIVTGGNNHASHAA
jgi:hypothetical protein